MASIDPTLEELNVVKKRLSESMKKVQEIEAELRELMAFINLVPNETRQ